MAQDHFSNRFRASSAFSAHTIKLTPEVQICLWLAAAPCAGLGSLVRKRVTLAAKRYAFMSKLFCWCGIEPFLPAARDKNILRQSVSRAR
jgi:hypothetical protein